MKNIKWTALWGMILILAFGWGCSKAPLPTKVEEEKVNENNETIEKVSILKVTATDINGNKIDSAEVYLDSELAGLTPVVDSTLTEGVHSLRIQKGGFEIYTERFLAEVEKPMFIEALLNKLPLNKGQLLVTVNEDSAITTLANFNKDIIDSFFEKEHSFILDPGGYFIKVEKEGYKLIYQAFEIKLDSVYVLNLNLEKSSSVIELPEISLILPDTGVVNVPFELSWESNNADMVDVDFIENPGFVGKREVTFHSTGMRYISATARNSAGETTVLDSILIVGENVEPKKAPSLTFSIDSDEVEYGDAVQISWESDGSQVIIDQGIGLRGPSGNEELYFKNPGMKIFTAVAYSEFGLTTTKKDTVLIKEPVLPELPIVSLAVVDSVNVGESVTIEWRSENALLVNVDYVQNSGLNGKSEVVFNSEGQKIITATAYNSAGQVTVAETLEVVIEEIGPQAEPILIAVMEKVCAIHPTIPQSLNVGEIIIEQDGCYQVTSNVWYDSGEHQKNESFFVVLKDEAGNMYRPNNSNAGNYRVVQDDPGSPHLALRNAGEFQLKAGKIFIEIYHYYTICEQYPQFVIDGPINGAESVEIVSLKFELCTAP